MDLWAITCLFNPAGYRRRLENYRIFREHLNAPLVAVELSCGGPFELGPGDADVLVQVRGSDVLWQKERLLNVALAHLPAECRNVAWLDCDIVFGRADWAAAASEVLRSVPLCQLFRTVYHLAADAPEIDGRFALESHTSFGRAVAAGERPQLGSTADHPGLAWAAHRGLLERFGLYDRRVTGGGDSYLAFGAVGRWEEVIEFDRCTPAQAGDYRAWAPPFYDAVRSRAGFVDTEVFHLWHGDRRNRKYAARHAILVEHDFDPRTDIALTGEGCWRWNSPKHEMHRRVREYFHQRREDGPPAGEGQGG